MIFVIYIISMLASAGIKDFPSNIGMTVKQPGVFGDAKKDGTEAIQKALNFAFENKEGNPVMFTASGYLFLGRLLYQ